MCIKRAREDRCGQQQEKELSTLAEGKVGVSAGEAPVDYDLLGAVLTHSAIRPSQQWDAIASWDGPFTNRTSERPIEQWAQPIHQSA